MRRCLNLSLIVGHLFICSWCCAQSNKIDSLKKILTSLRDTARIDCLDAISLQYLLKSNRYSALYYVNIVQKESEKINDIHSIAVAFWGTKK
jgi:hypothetical protein